MLQFHVIPACLTFAEHCSPVVEVNCCEMSMRGEDAAWGRRVLKVPQIGVRARLDYKEKD